MDEKKVDNATFHKIVQYLPLQALLAQEEYEKEIKMVQRCTKDSNSRSNLECI